MTARAQRNLVPLALGFGTLIAAILLAEILIRIGLVNRFIVPLPTQIAGALVNVGRSFNLSEVQLFRKIYFPAALPTIFVGMRLGMIFALINIVGVEFLINFGGLGQLINDLAERYDLPGTYAAICFVILVSIVFFFLTDRIERWLRPAA